MFEVMNYKSNEVEIVTLNDEILFNAKQVGEILEIKDIKSTIRSYNDKQKIRITNSMIENSDVHSMHGRKLNNAGETFLTEAGVYKLVFKSRKPEAEKFTDWIAEEVLPSIRKTGGYIQTAQEDDEQTIMARALLVAQATIEKKQQEMLKLQEENESLINKIEEQQPDVEFSERIQAKNKILYDMQKTSGLLKLGYGNITLFRKLRECGVLKKDNTPYQEHIKRERFEVVVTPYEVKGEEKYSTKTLVTTKGLKWLSDNIEKFNL